jgi:hypothetical protein
VNVGWEHLDGESVEVLSHQIQLIYKSSKVVLRYMVEYTLFEEHDRVLYRVCLEPLSDARFRVIRRCSSGCSVVGLRYCTLESQGERLKMASDFCTECSKVKCGWNTCTNNKRH